MALLLPVLVVAAVAGAIAAIAGFGIGSLLTPLLALSYGTKLAVVLVSLPHFVATALRAWMLRDAVNRRVLLTFGIPSAAGGLLGALLHAIAGNDALSAVLGVLLLFAGISGASGLSARLHVESARWSIALGALSGGFGGLVGNQGGLRSAALLHFAMDGRAVVATATAIGLLVDVARIPVYLASSSADIASHWPVVVIATVGVVAGTLVGGPILRRLPEPVFRRTVFALIAILGLALVVGASA